jgi:hypothetical protein
MGLDDQGVGKGATGEVWAIVGGIRLCLDCDIELNAGVIRYSGVYTVVLPTVASHLLLCLCLCPCLCLCVY